MKIWVRYIVGLFGIFVSLSISAQSSISGNVIDGSGEPVPYASVVVYKTADSSIVTTGATDFDGKFLIETKPGSYYIKIVFLSFEEKTIQNIDVKGGQVNLGKISLKPGSIDLGEYEVVSEKSQMELKLDKRVFNVGKDLSNTGSNAAEILDNVPSVTVDVEGNVSLRGSQNVRILIDGRPSGLTGVSVADALRQIQGSMIESIELITNPSSKYDAEGEVGIINVILKKEKRDGVNGSFELSAGYPHNHNFSFNLNYRKKWMNLFASSGVSYRQSPGNGYSIQRFTGDTVFSYERIRNHTRGGLASNTRFGSDLFLNDKNTLTVAGLYSFSEGNNNASLIYNDYGFGDVLTQVVTRTDDEIERQENIEGSISYLKTFKKKDQKFTIDAKWIRSDDTEKSDLYQESDNGDLPISQRTSNTEDEENFLIQTDYVHPFGKKGKFETGLKSTMRTIENDYTVEELDGDGNWFTLTNYDNHFIYQENIHAAYVILGNQGKRFSYQGGVRAEYSDIKTELVKTNESNPRSYLNFFPSAHLSYELDSTNTLQLSYSRRLSRPSFRHLLPFFSFSDPRSFYSGNPNLNPEYTNSFELGHLKYFGKGSLLSSVYYRYRTGVIERITTVDSVGFTKVFPVNLSVQNAVGLEFNFNYDITKWWRFNSSFNFYRAITNGEYNGKSLNSDTYTWTSRGTSKFTIKKKTDFQVSFNYRAPELTTQGKSLAMYSIDLGLSRDVLKGNGTIVLSAKDIFNSRKRRSITETTNYYSESEFQWRTRQLIISFSYRLNQKKQRNKDGGGYEGGDGDF